MSKQELIERIDIETFAYPDMVPETKVEPTVEFKKGYNCACDNIKRLVEKKLDEPKKEVVPQDVADFIEDGNRYDKISFLVHQKYLGVNSLMRECPVKDWLRSVDYKTVLSLVNSYEVEKEQLYYVDFINDGDVHKRLVLDNENGKYNIVDWSENLIGLVQEMFTESDVKKANPDFMAFAVKVED